METKYYNICLYFLRREFLTFIILRFDLSPPPPVPSEKLPPALKSRLLEAWKGDGFCGVAGLGWLPNWKGLAPEGADEPNMKAGDGDAEITDCCCC